MMRLRLSIQRHGLPPAQILWNAGGLRPNHAASGPNSTVSNFLEQINEVLPLESEEWGLEDYVVEVEGFECLHFCPITQILKDEDKVTVRPYNAIDRRVRRVSGREQISADGKHLIDGVAFGQPFLRHSNRPKINIPSLKRPSLSQDLSYNIGDDAIQPSQLLLQNGANNESDDGSDEEYNGFEESDLEKEVQDLATELDRKGKSFKDAGSTRYALRANPVSPDRQGLRKRKRGGGLGIAGVSAFIDEEYEHSESRGRNYSSEQYGEEQSNNYLRPTKRRSRSSKQATKKFPTSRQSSRSSTKSVHFEGNELETPATLRAVEDSDEPDNGNFVPGTNTHSHFPESDKENIEPHLKDSLKQQGKGSDADSDSGSDSDSDSVGSNTQPTTTSSNDDSSSVSSDDSRLDSVSSSNTNPESGSDTDTDSDSDPKLNSNSSTDSSSCSSSDNEPFMQKTQKGSQPENVKTNTNSDKPASRSESKTVAPGQGSKQTKKRNERRRFATKLANLKAKGILPGGATVHDYKEWIDDSKRSEPCNDEIDKASVYGHEKEYSLDSTFLPAVETAPYNEKQVASVSQQRNETQTAQNVLPSCLSLCGALHEKEPEVLPGITQAEEQLPSVTQTLQSSTSQVKPRARLDVASSRRLLFGSLGLRAPKTKSDEAEIRKKLMENARPPVRSQKPVNNSFTHPNHDDNDVWKSKITLKAIECCHSGVELSAPPFPFVQRWGSQQQGAQGKNKTGSKGKKRKRNHDYGSPQDDSHYQEDLDYMTDQVEPAELELKQDSTTGKPQSEGGEIGAITGKPSLRNVVAGMEDSPENDIMELPEDLSAYQTLTTDTAVPRAIVAFKQIDMSAETNWSPSISGYRTAVINKVLENGQLELNLALRDRSNQERKFDPETGERLYGKFEMPDVEGYEDQHDGILKLAISEMIEPILLQGVRVIQTDLLKNAIDLNEEAHKGDAGDDSGKTEYSALASNSKPRISSRYVHGMHENASGTATAPETRAVGPHNTANVTETLMPAKVSEDARQEYSMLIKDARFCPTLDSDIVPGRLSNHIKQNDVSPRSRSPSFSGISSRSIAQESAIPLGGNHMQANDEPHAITNPPQEQAPIKHDGPSSALPIEDTNSHINAQSRGKGPDKGFDEAKQTDFHHNRRGDSYLCTQDISVNMDGSDGSDGLRSPFTLFSQPNRSKQITSSPNSEPELSLPSLVAPTTWSNSSKSSVPINESLQSVSDSYGEHTNASAPTVPAATPTTPGDPMQDSKLSPKEHHLPPMDESIPRPQVLVDMITSSDPVDSEAIKKRSLLMEPGWLQKLKAI